MAAIPFIVFASVVPSLIALVTSTKVLNERSRAKKEAARNFPTSSRQLYYSHHPPGLDYTEERVIHPGLGNGAGVSSSTAVAPSYLEAYDARPHPRRTPGPIAPPPVSSRPGLGSKASVSSATPVGSEADYTTRWCRSQANSHAPTLINDSPPPTFRSSPPPTFRTSSPPPAELFPPTSKTYPHPNAFASSSPPPRTRRPFPPELNLYYTRRPNARELRYIGAVQNEPIHAVTRHSFHRPHLTLHRDVTDTSESIATLERLGMGRARVWTS